ncbi:PP2C family protein-serine/threonine phosphatase [Methanobrevibacter sp. YE315]|uniref:PP2C family protein-serine/threonine phosphatase n=1 Tax=Methanobrevibacter sp. YE315 TaxID=1609968 RepID=UPI0018CBFD59|nr:PP2C family protein-serine/threonine phosphatase [Methanobrevibacter sp. YE315]
MMGKNFGEGFSPHVGLLVISGLLFGPYGAIGSVLGNTLCDLIRGYNLGLTATSEIVSLGISYLAYKIWYEPIKSRPPVNKPRLNNTSNILLFLGIVIVCSLLFALINKKLFNLMYPETIPLNMQIGIRYYVNFINSGFLFGIIGIWISKRIDFVHIPKKSKRKLNKKLYYGIGIILAISTLIILITDYYFNISETISVIEVILLTSLIFLYTTKPITAKIYEITFTSIPEKIMNIFLLTTMLIVILGMLVSLDPVLIRDIDEIFLIGFNEVKLSIMVFIDILLIIFFIPSIAVLRYVEHEVIYPITSFSKIEKFVKKGDKIESEGLIDIYSDYLNNEDEIGMLARSYTDLINYTNEYIENIHKIESEKEKIKAELNIAERIQKSNLPTHSIENEDYTVYGFSKPAKEVGGDFYDYYPIDEDNVAIIIGDASGKGVPAALLSTITQSIIRQILKSETDPSKALYMLNNQLCENNTECMFVTLWLGIYNNKTKDIIFSNAGHNSPLVMEDGQFRALKVNNGISLGIMSDYEFITEKINISKGIIVYTDGITDEKNSNDEFYGKDRVIDFLNNHTFENKVITNLLQDIDRFKGTEEQFDDMTLVLLDRHK